MATAKDFRRIAVALDGTSEAPHFDRTAFKVRRIYATLAPDGKTANLMLTRDEQALKCEVAPEAFFPVANPWGVRGATTVHSPSRSSRTRGPWLGGTLSRRIRRVTADGLASFRNSQISKFAALLSESIRSCCGAFCFCCSASRVLKVARRQSYAPLSDEQT